MCVSACYQVTSRGSGIQLYKGIYTSAMISNGGGRGSGSLEAIADYRLVGFLLGLCSVVLLI